MAGSAIHVVMSRSKTEHLSLDEIVQLVAVQPGEAQIIEERPHVVMVGFEDGSGVGVNSEGLDLLKRA
jgi:hypothetical protein